jgi:hypothetical protein
VAPPLVHTPHLVVWCGAVCLDCAAHCKTPVDTPTFFGLAGARPPGPRKEAAGWLTVPTVATA